MLFGVVTHTDLNENQDENQKHHTTWYLITLRYIKKASALASYHPRHIFCTLPHRTLSVESSTPFTTTTTMPANATSKPNATGNAKKATLNSIYASFGGWPRFMQSYGLKTWDDDDVEEGRRIAQAMLEHDLEDQKEGQAK